MSATSPANGDDTGPTTTRIQVVVRVRPVLAHESAEDVAVSCSDDGGRVQVNLPLRNVNKEALPGHSQSIAKSYSFDACLPGRTTQGDLAEVCSLPELVGQALDGYCVTIFAFGQTGSGKTHTMVGPRLSRLAPGCPTPSAACEEDDGLLPRCLSAVYEGIEQRKDSMQIKVSGSCVELYNEAVTDLLGPDKNKQLQVRKEERGGFKVEGLTQVECSSAQTALHSMARALMHRHTRAHALNEYSSRSHCLMTFCFDSQEQGESREEGAQGGVRRHGRLVLVDLAGSERLKSTGSSGQEAVRETGAINKSLFTLGQVLAALAARSGRSQTAGSAPVHVPYRDSKLTQLLWDGLRGTGRVLMLACLGPLAGQAEESLNTLHFASMALRIKAQPIMFVDPQDALVLELRGTIKQLQEENRQLAAAMSQLSSGVAPAEVFATLPEQLRLAAARDTLGSAPAAGRPTNQTAAQVAGGSGEASTSSSAHRPKTEAGLHSPARPVPWKAANASGAPSPAKADTLALSHGSLPPHHSSPHQHQQLLASLLANPVDYSSSVSLFAKPSKLKRPVAKGAPYTSMSSAAAISQEVTANLREQLLASIGGGLGPSTSASTVHSQASKLPAIGGGGVGQQGPKMLPAPRLHMEAFPELAALEEQFQNMLGGKPTDNHNSEHADQDQTEPPPPPAPEPQPEPKALNWAERNTWFGSNQAMTAFAYEVHDDLVNNQGVDASTDAYYEAIEHKVKVTYPEEWAAWEAEVAAAAAAAAEAAKATKQPPKPPPPPSSHNFGAALRVMGIKDPMPWETTDGIRHPTMFSPQRGVSNPNLARSRYAPHSSPAKASVSSMPHALSSPADLGNLAPVPQPPVASPSSRSPDKPKDTTQHQYLPSPLANKSYSNPNVQHTSTTSMHSRRPSQPAAQARRAPSPQMHGALTKNPSRSRSGADYFSATQQDKLKSKLLVESSATAIATTPVKAKSMASKTLGIRQPESRPGANMLRKLDLSAWSQPGGLPTELTIAELQAEYMRQRFVVLEELRQAKAEAEQERSRILAKIGTTLGSSRWRQ